MRTTLFRQKNPLAEKISNLKQRVEELMNTNHQDELNTAIKEYVDCRYNEQICPYDPMPDGLNVNDYRLLWNDLQACSWGDVPDPDKAENPWVREQLHRSEVYWYHKEEGRDI